MNATLEQMRVIDRRTVELPRAVKRPDGSLYGERAVLTHCGVQQYTHDDFPHLIAPGEVWHVLTDRESLTDPQFLESLKLSQMTLRHPKNADINVRDAKQKSIGAIGSAVAFDEATEELVADWTINRIEGIRAVDAGASSLSIGYDAVMVPVTPYVHPKYGRVTHVRRHCVANHTALLLRGEAPRSPRARIRALDSGDPTMIKWSLLVAALAPHGVTVDIADDATPEDAAKAIAGTRVVDSSKAAEIGTLKAERDALQLKADALQKELDEARSARVIDAAVKARAGAVQLAAQYGVDVGDLTTPEIRLAVVRAIDAEFPEDAPEEQVDAFLRAVAVAPKSDRWAKAQESIRTTDSNPKKPKAPDADGEDDFNFGTVFFPAAGTRED